VTRRYEEGSVITVTPDDTLLTAFQRMRLADVSQVPVMEHGKCVGVLDESDLLLAIHRNGDFHQRVRTSMTTRLETVGPECTLDHLYAVLDRGMVALVVDQGRFIGLITRTDLLAYLRRKLQ
jgi:cystathionine beta-synthase